MTRENINKAKEYVRLNTKNLTDIHKLMVEVNYEIFGLIFNVPEMKESNFKLHKVDNYHSSPIGERTNWGGRDKNYPTTFVGWKLNNSRGTYRTKDDRKPKDSYIKELNNEVGINIISDSFWTTGCLSFNNGINTGTFNGGPNFMGCFQFFIDDFPHIKNKLEFHFSKEDIMRIYGIKDWNQYLRQRKLARLTSKFQN